MEKQFRSKGRNPVLPPDIRIPDGEAHVFHDKLYVYGSFDVSAKEYCSEEYHVASTSDMLTWEVGEKSLDGNDIPWPDDKKKKKYYVVDMGLKDPTPVYREILKGMHIPLGLMPKASARRTSISPHSFRTNIFSLRPIAAKKTGNIIFISA